jgi:hypothetical protein
LIEDDDRNFKKLLIYYCIVSDEDANETKFYLTVSPYCSSVLELHYKKLQPYDFLQVVDVKVKVTLKAKSISFFRKDIFRLRFYLLQLQGSKLHYFTI